MSVTLIQDLRWGDTGKGKISAHESSPDRCDISARAVGGGNAGHVIQLGVRKMSLHLLPAGCVHDGVEVVLGRGMVTHLPTLLKEIDDVRALFETDPELRMVIAPENHLLFDAHKRADKKLENRKGNGKVGTTGSGIGPAYADKALRTGLRMEALKMQPDALKDKYRTLVKHWAATYGVQLESDEQDADIATLLTAKERLEGLIQIDMTSYWREKLGNKARVLIEGAQGSLLSIDNEDYPYVTASATTTSGHMQGVGIPQNQLNRVIGVFKAYETRVGEGPLPHELDPIHAARLREKGGERGSTTGRDRRLAWLDAYDTKRRAWEEGATELAIMKGDILDDEEQIPVSFLPSHVKHYSMFDGWKTSTRSTKEFENLPPKAQAFYKALGNHINVPIRFIGTGPENDDLIEMPQ